MNSLTKCKNCGGDYGIHHYLTDQCPVGGREAPVNRKQEWKVAVFEPDDNEIAAYQARIRELEVALADIHKRIYRALVLDNISPTAAEDIFAVIAAKMDKKESSE